MILKSSHSPCFVVVCDECKSEVEWLQMRNGRMVIEDGKALTVKGEWYDIPINHYVVCSVHGDDMENYDIFGWNKAGLEVVPAGCPACQDSDVILESHFMCWPTDRKIVQGPILTASGWYALVE